MAETAILKLEEMLPEAAYFIEKDIFSEKEMRDIMGERRALEFAVNSRSYTLRDYLNYINHEIRVECLRRERYEQRNIRKISDRDTSIVKRIHSLFNRCLSKFSHDVSVWKQYIEFCSNGGCSKALSRVLMKAIKRHPRVATFRIIAADRELQQGNLLGARKLLMRTVRVGTDDQRGVWQQLFKLECLAVHKLATSSMAKAATSTESAGFSTTEEENAEDPRPKPSCAAALVVYRHALKDLARSVRDTEAFKVYAREAVDALEISTLGFTEPHGLNELKSAVRV
jgi:hypothetical protein